ncbi:MAG: Sec-independent protein translocase protein TatB [Roseibium album]|uniref:Sec-independent protein translocase protein TatB n=1 Tax=Roseibium album TaxID=311410 RepID=UPI0018C9DAE2|nr:sec-independent protein translocase protein TatB [Labrenzia sp. EL_162]MBG6176902.1 sec-independent protein translocase protein TatB [Labrenzia sp. EL_132]MBG6194676.1 sec-independent protein translocase protein TatB [Labrenzia sp. EL_159]MBG6231519.1 sec-independent protein translocase protein TatB [Labrenzia sp. EL_208]
MFDIGWTELMVIACVAIIVVGPKDLPRMLRTLGQTIGKARRMSREFQSTFNDALREAEQQADIADMKKQVEDVANFNPLGDLKKSIEEDAAQKASKPMTTKPPSAQSETAVEEKAPAEPAKGDAEQPEAVAAAEPADNPDRKPVTEDVKA